MISVYARLNTQNGSYQPHDVNHTESEPNQNNPYNRGDSMILRFHMPTIARGQRLCNIKILESPQR